jgi:HD-GYP domain-containing protein (c-di-GMP phosphodiesterase class II)
VIRLPIGDVRPGMRAARTLFYEWGGTMLQAGAPLDETIVRKLASMGFTHVYVYDDDTADIPAYELMNETERRRITAKLQATFDALREETRRTLPPEDALSLSERELSSRMESPKVRQAVERMRLREAVQSAANSILDNLRRRSELAVCVGILKSQASWLFDHALEVAVYSAILARHFDLTRSETEELTLGALLHDVGYIFLPEDVLAEPGPASPERKKILRRHAALGYHFLRDALGVSILSAHVAYQHHERPDGSGYPRGLRGDLPIVGREQALGQDPGTIHRYAAIVAVPNAYCMWQEPRAWHQPVAEDTAYERLLNGAGTRFNTQVVEAFTRMIPRYPVGTLVQVRSGPYAGYRGVVAEVRPEDVEHPVVRLLYSPDGARLPAAIELDTAAEPVRIRVVVR